METHSNLFDELSFVPQAMLKKTRAPAAELSAMSADESQKWVDEILSKKLTTSDRILGIFSTHSNIVKRLRALKELN